MDTIYDAKLLLVDDNAELLALPVSYTHLISGMAGRSGLLIPAGKRQGREARERNRAWSLP